MQEFNFSSSDISDNFDTLTVSRGLRYYQQNAVLHCQVGRDRDGDWEIESVVRGRRPYRQEISIYQDTFHEILIEGNCSCPVGHNCKHVVAASYYILHNHIKNTLPRYGIEQKAPEEL